MLDLSFLHPLAHSVATLRLCPALPIASHKLVEPAALQRQWDGWMQTCSGENKRLQLIVKYCTCLLVM